MALKEQLFMRQEEGTVLDLHQGDCVQLLSREELFQVIGIDIEHKRCWVRRWPLERTGSPVFEVSIQQIDYSSSRSGQSNMVSS